MPCAGFSIGLFLSFRKVLVLITFISAPVSILKIIGISPIFNFTCQRSIFSLEIHSCISLCRLFPYFANILCLRPTNILQSDSFYHSFCKIFPFAGQLSNLWYLLHFLHRDVFAIFCGLFFHPECFVVSFLSLVTASTELSCISPICVLTRS